jgi:hypothetical protein
MNAKLVTEGKTLLRVLTNSERTTFACPRRWWFRYIQGLTTLDAALPLKTGSLWHQCLEAWYRSTCTMTVNDVKTSVIDVWMEKRKAFHKPSAFDVDMVEQEDRDVAAEVLGMFKGYVVKWFRDMEDFDILHVEPTVGRWLRDNGNPVIDYVKIKGKTRRRTWAYGGAVDLVVRQRSTGLIWFMEHKTTADTDLQKYLHKLHWDPQIRGYAWALQNPSHGEVKAPLQIAGVIYNVARKKLPRVPELLKDGKRLSKAAIDTTREVFLKAILDNGLSPDLYADKLEELKSVTFFEREFYPITAPELVDFEKDVIASARLMIAEERAAYHPRQTTVCVGFKASGCEFASNVCLEDGPQMRKAFNVMGLRHAELEGDLAEPWVLAQRQEASALTGTPMMGTPSVEDTPQALSEDAPDLSPTDVLADPDDPFAKGDEVPF